jgi:DNA mismatch repair protein MutL
LDFDNESHIEIPTTRKNQEIKAPSVDINKDYNPFDEEKNRFQHSGFPPHKKEKIPEGWEKLFEEQTISNKENGSEESIYPENQQTQTSAINTEETGANGGSKGFFQLKGKYILTQVKSGMMIIDQKRAHERILFEQFLEAIETQKGIGQKTLYPETVELDPSDHALISDIQDDLGAIGFDIRDFGSNTVVIHGVPAHLGEQKGASVLEALIEEYKQTQNDIKGSIHENIAQSLAKASSINYGTILAGEEMRELTDNLFACKMPNYSPSGNLIINIVSIEEVDKRF